MSSEEVFKHCLHDWRYENKAHRWCTNCHWVGTLLDEESIPALSGPNQIGPGQLWQHSPTNRHRPDE